MNHAEFESRIKMVSSNLDQFDRRREARIIVRELFLQDGVIAGIYRDKEDLMDCQYELIVLSFENRHYMWIDFMKVGGIWQLSQLERIDSDYHSTLLFTTEKELGNVACQILSVLDKFILITGKE